MKLPEYLNMVRDAADPEDLPSNTSHETLQQSMVLRAIKTCPAKKHLEVFTEITQNNDDYKVSREQFVSWLMLGIHEGLTNRTMIAESPRSHTSRSKDEQGQR